MNEYEIIISDYNAKHNKGFIVNRPNGSGDFLFILFLSEAEVIIDNKYFLINKGGCILYEPQYPQYYKATDEFCNSYIHFKSKKNILINYNINPNNIFYPKKVQLINYLIEDITNDQINKADFWEDSIDHLMNRLMIETGRYSSSVKKAELSLSEQSLVERISNVRMRMLKQPNKNWSIEMLCSLSLMSQSRFFCLYKKIYNMSPVAELINARINLAEYYLTNNSLTIADISELCGYNNVFHFIRQFKKITGITPGYYRNKNY